MDTFHATHDEVSEAEQADSGSPARQNSQMLADYRANMHDFHRLVLDHHSLLQQHLQNLREHARLYVDSTPGQKRSHAHHNHQQLLQEHRLLLHYHHWLLQEHRSWLQQAQPDVSL